jgi:PAS domain S-box-containing protein
LLRGAGKDGQLAKSASKSDLLDAYSGDLDDDLAVARLVTEHAADAIFLLDGEGCTTFANPAAEALFGWPLSELKGMTLHEVVHYKHPDGRPYPMDECPLGQVFASGRSLKLHEDVFFHKDGSPVPVACSNAAISRRGQVVGGVIIVRDISERHEAERRQQLLLNELNHRVKNTRLLSKALLNKPSRATR